MNETSHAYLQHEVMDQRPKVEVLCQTDLKTLINFDTDLRKTTQAVTFKFTCNNPTFYSSHKTKLTLTLDNETPAHQVCARLGLIAPAKNGAQDSSQYSLSAHGT